MMSWSHVNVIPALHKWHSTIFFSCTEYNYACTFSRITDHEVISVMVGESEYKTHDSSSQSLLLTLQTIKSNHTRTRPASPEHQVVSDSDYFYSCRNFNLFSYLSVFSIRCETCSNKSSNLLLVKTKMLKILCFLLHASFSR